ncbi:uncharacterized protein EAF02_004216 [Botrytis sinoallii]|uniref:uncharacterized protein n=1 Tax=Botrytis sinoallii TaxID=1463999 RepID=UPI0019019281|nr:uncharacterized protein EAF02_004216 [Botrytis sinoallii]KAF7885707.1 hypothetical protein EAF02_004216 [Botrytis sinoallii]
MALHREAEAYDGQKVYLSISWIHRHCIAQIFISSHLLNEDHAAGWFKIKRPAVIGPIGKQMYLTEQIFCLPIATMETDALLIRDHE